MHILGKEGLGPVRGGFLISNYVVYRAVMAVWVGILYNSGDFAILCFVLLTINVCLCFIPSKSQTCGYFISLTHLL